MTTDRTRTRRGGSSLARLVMLTALLVGVVACGDDGAPADPAGLSEDERTAADNLAAQILNSGVVAGESSVNGDEAKCLAEGSVTDVGLEDLKGYGILTADLKVDRSIQGVKMAAEDAEALAGVFVKCLDAEALFEKQLLGGERAQGLTSKQKDCVRGVLDEDGIRDVLSRSFQGSSDVYAGVRDELGDCVPQQGRKAG